MSTVQEDPIPKDSKEYATQKPTKKPMQDSLARNQNPSNEFAYRTFSKSAIASAVFALLGILLTYMASHMLILPIMAIGFGAVALSNFRKFPDELTGKILAKIGLVVGLILAITGATYHTYVYNTEVPDGYKRISYGLLRPNTRTPVPFSEKALEFDGKKVFLKGYVRPSDKKRNLKNFILVGDFGDCCFGGDPKPTDVVGIRIKIDETVDHSYSLRKIGGTFRLNERKKQTGDKEVPLVYYEIEADYIR